MEEPQLKYHISWTVGGVVIGGTFLIWLLQFLLTVTVALIPVAMFIGEATEWVVELILWFLMRSYFMRGKRMVQRILALFLESGVEFVPFLNCIVPVLPFATLYQIHSYRADDYARYQAAHAKWEEETRREQEDMENQYIASVIAARANDNEEEEALREAA